MSETLLKSFILTQGARELDQLRDVTLSSLADNDVLQFNSATSLWENVTPTTLAGTLDHGNLIAASLLDDDHPQYLLAAGTRALTADWDAGSFKITAETFESDVVTGTAPFTVASTTRVANLNADKLDGNEAAAFGLLAGNNTWTGTFKHQNASDSTTAFQILDADGGPPVVNVDTTNERMGVGVIPETKFHAVDIDTALKFEDGLLTLLGSVTRGVNAVFEGNSAAFQFRDINGSVDQKNMQMLVNSNRFIIRGLTDLFATTFEFMRFNFDGSSVVFNEGGADMDFRVEGDTQANLLFINAGDNSVGIGTDTPDSFSMFHIVAPEAQANLQIESDVAVGWIFNVADGPTDNKFIHMVKSDAAFIIRPLNDNLSNAGTPFAMVTTIGATRGHVGFGLSLPLAQVHIDQTSSTGAVPVLYLDQADVSEEMIEFATTIGTGNAIEAIVAKTLTTTHFVKVTLPGGLTRYLPVGTIDETITEIDNADSPYTVLDSDFFIFADSSGGAITINLPALSSSQGRILYVKRNGGSNVTLDGNGSETIDGSTTRVISTDLDAPAIIAKTGDWAIF